MYKGDGCIVKGCKSDTVGLGYCSKHYQRYKKYGNASIRLNTDKNHYIIENDVVFMDLYNSDNEIIAVTSFNAVHLDKLTKYKWHLKKSNVNYYVCSNFKNKKIYMARVILDINNEKLADHINGDTLNNTNDNLRIVTSLHNAWNRIKRCDNKSGHIGVYWNKRAKKWYADIGVNSKTVSIGYFENLADAINARKEAEEKYFGEYARQESD